MKVDCNEWLHICQAAAIQAYPSLRLYMGGRERQSHGGIHIPLQPELSAKDMASIIREMLEKVKGQQARDEL